MKLEVGMYVRYLSGFHHNEQNKPIVLIGKVLEITDNELIKLDTFFCGWMFPIREFKKLMKGEPSFNPIDLIEVGDYVNGMEVTRISGTRYDDNDLHCYCEHNGDENWKRVMIPAKDIKTIATKEQFEAMQYKVVQEC